MAFTDCTEQPLPRPKNKVRRRLYYSGKKQKHTHGKEPVHSKSEGPDNLQIQAQTDRQEVGMKHNYRIYKKNHPDIPKTVMGMYDLGFLGVEKDHLQQRSSLPFKKEKDWEHTVQQKEYNKNHSAKRIVIEHAICRIKKYKIMNDVFRDRLIKYDRI